MKQQAADGDFCVIDGLLFIAGLVLRPKLVSGFAAVAINAKTNIVQKQVCFAVYGHRRQALQIWVNAKDRGGIFGVAKIPREVVTRPHREVVDRSLNTDVLYIIGKTV